MMNLELLFNIPREREREMRDERRQFTGNGHCTTERLGDKSEVAVERKREM